ncbi:MAG: hypothetical protein ACK5KR_00460 [Breznakia sp.]
MRVYKYVRKIIMDSVILCFIFAHTTTFAKAAVSSDVVHHQVRAWPGRSGGNDDGSEAWLQESYGQMNGPYKLLTTSRGTTKVHIIFRNIHFWQKNENGYYDVSKCKLYREGKHIYKLCKMVRICLGKT